MALTVSDRLAISEVIARYCHATDAGDGPRTAAEFTADGILEIKGAWQARGSEQIAEIGSFPNKPKHWVNSIVIDGDGSTASSIVYYAAIRGGGSLLATGRYESVLTKQLNGQWKLVHHCYVGDPVDAPVRQPATTSDAPTAEDRLAIMELVGRYNNSIDQREPAAWAATFVPGGVFQVDDNPEIRGHAALEQMVRELPPANGRHWTTNTLIEGRADAASARMYLAIINRDDAIMTGTYHDQLQKQAGVWRFTSRHVLVDSAP